jgi:hypothetical protein
MFDEHIRFIFSDIRFLRAHRFTEITDSAGCENLLFLIYFLNKAFIFK